MWLVMLGVACRLVKNCSAAAESGVARSGAGVHARAVPLVLLDVRRRHDEVTDLPGTATRVQGARLISLVLGCPARVSPVVCACGRGDALSSRVLGNGTCGHVLRDSELREPLGKRQAAGPDRTREVELNSGTGDWCIRDGGRCCWARKRQMFLVELFHLVCWANEAVVAISN